MCYSQTLSVETHGENGCPVPEDVLIYSLDYPHLCKECGKGFLVDDGERHHDFACPHFQPVQQEMPRPLWEWMRDPNGFVRPKFTEGK